MKKLARLILLSFFLFRVSDCFAQYIPDILGDDYLSHTIKMPDDYEGEVVCTLIKKPALSTVKQAILYIHGYNDYFFQKELGDSVCHHGYNFYAIDLRKYGRSILPHQDPFFCKNINEYFADIDTALSIIRTEGNNQIILMGHSTGGLISSLYLDSKDRVPYITALILNSPFLDMNMSPFVEKIGIPVISFLGGIFPRLVVQKTASHSYAYSLLKKYNGEWEFNTDWKKTHGHPKRAGWIRAIHKGHKQIQKGTSLPYPILVLSSDKSTPETDTWNDAYQISDIVLDVNDIRKYGYMLGENVTYKSIPDGKHDLVLSVKPARDFVYHVIFDWLTFLK